MRDAPCPTPSYTATGTPVRLATRDGKQVAPEPPHGASGQTGKTKQFQCPHWPDCNCPGGTVHPNCPGLITMRANRNPAQPKGWWIIPGVLVGFGLILIIAAGLIRYAEITL